MVCPTTPFIYLPLCISFNHELCEFTGQWASIGSNKSFTGTLIDAIKALYTVLLVSCASLYWILQYQPAVWTLQSFMNFSFLQVELVSRHVTNINRKMWLWWLGKQNELLTELIHRWIDDYYCATSFLSGKFTNKLGIFFHVHACANETVFFGGLFVAWLFNGLKWLKPDDEKFWT